MDRREFLKQVAAWSAGLAVGVPLLQIGTARGADGASTAPADGTAGAGGANKPAPVVSVVKGKDYEAMAERVLAPLGGIGAFVKRGDKVVIKPNIGWDRNVDQGANTHPAVVVGLVKLALAAGAAKVQVFDRSCANMQRSYANSGIKAAVEAIGDAKATCPYIDNRKFVPVKIQNSKALTQWDLYRDALEADCYINVPVAKHHGLTRLTLGMKNILGVCAGDRGKIHDDIEHNIAELTHAVGPKLTVIDATRIMLRNGPQSRNPADVKVLDTLIASVDPVAIDAYATTLFGLKPGDIKSTVAAYEMGMGEMDLDKIKLVQA